MVVVLGDGRMYEFTGGAPLPLDQLRERYRRLAVGRSTDGSELWFNWIVRLIADGVAVGVVQATVAAEGSSADVAWEVGVPWQGRGIASEAAVAIVDWLVGRGVVDISACIHPDHHASARVAARAGLTATSEIVDDEVVWRLQTSTLASMPEVEPVPERLQTVTPRLVFGGDVAVAMRFYVDAFGAEVVEEPFVDPDGRVVHAEIRIGDSVVFVTDEGADGNGVAPATVGGRVTAVMALNVADVDQLWERAVAAGCEVIYPLADQFYGDRGGRLRDPYGHQWMLSTHIEDVDRDELERRMRGDAGR